MTVMLLLLCESRPSNLCPVSPQNWALHARKESGTVLSDWHESGYTLRGRSTRLIRDEFEERTVRVAEVEARPKPLCTKSLDGSQLNCDPKTCEMGVCGTDGARPDEAQIATTGLNRQPCDGYASYTWTMQIQLRLAKSIGPARSHGNQLSTQDVAIKRI